MLDIPVKEERETYEVAIRSQLAAWDAEIECLEARTDIKLACIEDRYYGLLRSLRARERELRELLQDLGQAGDGSWDEIKENLDKERELQTVALGDAESELSLGQ